MNAESWATSPDLLLFIFLIHPSISVSQLKPQTALNISIMSFVQHPTASGFDSTRKKKKKKQGSAKYPVLDH